MICSESLEPTVWVGVQWASCLPTLTGEYLPKELVMTATSIAIHAGFIAGLILATVLGLALV
ncbi:hypothetical protein [Jannaschia ovalis]|uniref:Uncharacterized protein n=1 Tax=Jannaschia ovalis TaxID=3038773 RepID=A0ABY8LGT1_9RHOB|nr:hypothetical protein [Jannaschia sp. GRR-S6-38]WGH79379.1 hypothetical protein P8627_03685 [Jannaschia sp. GRR-S6-38]